MCADLLICSGVNGGTLSSFLLHFKTIFDGEGLLDPVQDLPPPPFSQNAVHTPEDQPTLAAPVVADDPPRNRNSRIYAESSEQMLGMGNRELESEFVERLIKHVSPLSNHVHFNLDQEEESETDDAGTEESYGGSGLDPTAKDAGLKDETAPFKPDNLTASSSMKDWESGNGNIPRSPRMDWSASTND
jgi:hypothetical protein